MSELWIRSQDKSALVKCDELHIYFSYDYEKKRRFDEIEYTDFTICNHSRGLGKYESQARCIEILDEIQKTLVQSTTSLDFGTRVCVGTHLRVYEMPEK